MLFKVFGLLISLLLLLVSCTKGLLDPKDLTIARVNGEPLRAHEFLISFNQLRGEQDEIAQKNPRLLEQLKTRALNEVIVMSLLRQEAAKKKVRVAREEVEARLNSWKDSYPSGGFEEMLRKQNTTEDYLKQRIEDQLLIEKITTTLFEHETMVSDEEMKKYFQAHQGEFVRPERIHAFQIVVPTIDEAEKIRLEIISGKQSFESAARAFSMSPDAAKGGDLGFFAKNEKIAAFNEAFSLSIGSVSKPIQSRYGVHLLKVVEKQASAKLSFNDARNDIVKSLRKQKASSVYREWVTKLLKDGEIYRNESLFQSIS